VLANIWIPFHCGNLRGRVLTSECFETIPMKEDDETLAILWEDITNWMSFNNSYWNDVDFECTLKADNFEESNGKLFARLLCLIGWYTSLGMQADIKDYRTFFIEKVFLEKKQMENLETFQK